MRGTTPLVAILTVLLIAVSAPHTGEDFQYGRFAALGLPWWVPGVALGSMLAVQAIGMYLVGRGSRVGIGLLVAAAAVWSITTIFIHGQEIVSSGEYRHGLISRALEVAIVLVGAATAIAGSIEWRKR